MPLKHDLIEVVDREIMPGEYKTGPAMQQKQFIVCGLEYTCHFHSQAMRSAIADKWDWKCECCGHALRWAYITLDSENNYHCLGKTCLSIELFGVDSVREAELAEKVKEKKTKKGIKFAASFSVPKRYWDTPKDKRPLYSRVWYMDDPRDKTKKLWFLTITGDTFRECMGFCMDATDRFGKLF